MKTDRMVAFVLQCVSLTPLAKLPQPVGRSLNGGVGSDCERQRPGDIMLSSGSYRPDPALPLWF